MCIDEATNKKCGSSASVHNIFPRPESHTQPFVIGKDTKIFLEGLPKNQQNNKVIDFKQIGGLSNVIEKLREIIQLPITYPDQLARFGIKPPKGMIMYVASSWERKDH